MSKAEVSEGGDDDAFIDPAAEAVLSNVELCGMIIRHLHDYDASGGTRASSYSALAMCASTSRSLRDAVKDVWRVLDVRLLLDEWSRCGAGVTHRGAFRRQLEGILRGRGDTLRVVRAPGGGISDTMLLLRRGGGNFCDALEELDLGGCGPVVPPLPGTPSGVPDASGVTAVGLTHVIQHCHKLRVLKLMGLCRWSLDDLARGKLNAVGELFCAESALWSEDVRPPALESLDLRAAFVPGLHMSPQALMVGMGNRL